MAQVSFCPPAREAVRQQRVGLGGEALGVVRIAGPGHAADAVHVAVGQMSQKFVGDQVVREFPRVAVRFERTGDLRDVLVGVLAAEGVHVPGEAVGVARVAEEEGDVVEQPGAFEETPVPGDPVEAGHDFVHAAVLAGDVAVPHADAGLGRQRR